jgi:hypothetical protein
MVARTPRQGWTGQKASILLIARGVHLRRVDREARCRVALAALLSREREISCLLDFG